MRQQLLTGVAIIVTAWALTAGAHAQSTDATAVNVGTLSSSPISQPTGGSPMSVPTGGGSTVNLGTALSTPAATQAVSPAAGTGTNPGTSSGTPATTQPTTGGSLNGTGTVPSQTTGETNATGSAGCAAITQAAANGLTARISADNQSINPPRSVTTMTCLNNFFNGIGLNVITNLLNPQLLLQAVEYQICAAVQSVWNSTIGQIQCGLTLTGFNLGFGGLGGGLSCPRLTFGGGGMPLGTLGFGFGTGLYITGNGLAPTGYSLPNVPQGTY